MTVHREDHRLCCHHCGHVQSIPAACPACQQPRLLTHGVGTEQLEAFLEQRFPDQAIVRVDRDTTRRKGSLQTLLDKIHQGQPGILLGTQMLAKGHDFPNVTLVGLLDIDQGLFGADFRAPERMGQLLIQVAGRAGRADKPGLVLIQTRQADHPWLHLLLDQGYPAFAEALLAERQAAELPPYSFQALLRADGPDAEAVMVFTQSALEAGKALTHAGIELLGPAPAIMERRAGRYRFHLLAQARQRPQLQAFVREWVPAVSQLPRNKRLRWSLDIDPQEL
jgi:primosomal protein N' (replication factor Y)